MIIRNITANPDEVITTFDWFNDYKDTRSYCVGQGRHDIVEKLDNHPLNVWRNNPKKPVAPTKWTLFTDTLCDGYIPSSVDSNDDGPDSWTYFDTEREAQLECLDVLETEIQQVRDGERDAEDSDLCGHTPDEADALIQEFKDGTRTWAQLNIDFELTYYPEEVTPTEDGGFIFQDRQYPSPEEADFR